LDGSIRVNSSGRCQAVAGFVVKNPREIVRSSTSEFKGHRVANPQPQGAPIHRRKRREEFEQKLAKEAK
jgi:hypothetical protein